MTYNELANFLETEEVKNSIIEGVAGNLTDIMDVALSLDDEQKFYDTVIEDVTSAILTAYALKTETESSLCDDDDNLQRIIQAGMRRKREQVVFANKAISDYRLAEWIVKKMQLPERQSQYLSSLLLYGLDNIATTEGLKELSIIPDDFYDFFNYQEAILSNTKAPEPAYDNEKTADITA